MITNYSEEPIKHHKQSIFLAGPSPRSKDEKSWRPEALEILESFDFDGLVYIPEWKNFQVKIDYSSQVEWEREALESSDAIVFWVPRNLPETLGLTTNVEFGHWLAKDAGRVVYGRPDNADKIRYLDWLYKEETREEPFNNLKHLLKRSLEIVDLFNKD